MDTGKAVRDFVVSLWNLPFDYQWTVRHLDERGLLRVYQLFIAATALFYGLISLSLVVWEHQAPGSLRTEWPVVVGAVISMLIAVAWVVGPWPSECVSGLFVIIANAAVFAEIVCCTDAFGAMPGLTLLAANGIYVMLMHGTRALLAHLAFSAVAVVFFTTVAVHQGTAASAEIAVRVLVLVPTVLGLPIVLQVFIMSLRIGASHALHDPLTLLYNRRGLSSAVTTLHSPPGPITVLAIDIDKFKSINDTEGHAAGDRVLVAVANAVRDVLPVGGVAARTGGEEFLVVMRGTERDGIRVADRLQSAMTRCEPEIGPTVSIGVAASMSATGWSLGTFEEIAKRADSAMYQAKNAGGGRSVVTADGGGLEYRT